MNLQFLLWCALRNSCSMHHVFPVGYCDSSNLKFEWYCTINRIWHGMRDTTWHDIRDAKFLFSCWTTIISSLICCSHLWNIVQHIEKRNFISITTWPWNMFDNFTVGWLMCSYRKRSCISRIHKPHPQFQSAEFGKK